MPSVRSIFAGSMSVCCYALAWGQTVPEERGERILADYSFEELAEIRVVVSAAGYSQNAREAPAAVTVLDRREWQSRGARTLNDLLRTLPGLHLTKVGTGVTKNRIMLRGLSGDFGQQVLVLVDGMPVNSLTDGGVLYGTRLPLLGFAQVELVKGSGSAIHGADAFGGVINLVGPAPGEMPSQIVMRGGAFGTWEAGFTHEVVQGEGSLQLAYEYQRSDDDPGKVVGADLQTTFDRLFGTSASRAPGRLNEHYAVSSLRADWRWKRLRFLLYDSRNLGSGLGAGTAQALDPLGEDRQTSTSARLAVDLSGLVPGQVDFMLTYRRETMDTLYNVLPAGARVPIGADGNINFANPAGLVLFTDGYIGRPGYRSNQYFAADLVHVFAPAQGHRLRWAAGASRSQVRPYERKNFGPGVINGTQPVVDGTLTDVTGTPYIFAINQDRRVWYLSLQDEWEMSPRFRATLGVRHDRYSDFGETTNPRLGLNYEIRKGMMLKVSAGTAFRAPSSKELYSANNPAGIGNPLLRPEKILHGEAGLTAILTESGQLQVGLSVFHHQAERLISFVRQPTSGLQVAQNIGQRRTTGLEGSVAWHATSELTAELNYTWLNENDERGRQPAGSPSRLGYAGLQWSPTGFPRFYLGAKFVGGRVRAVTDLRPPVKDYIWGVARLEREFGRCTLALNIENLFGVDAREPSNGSIPDDFPLAGRQWLLEAVWRF